MYEPVERDYWPYLFGTILLASFGNTFMFLHFQRFGSNWILADYYLMLCLFFISFLTIPFGLLHIIAYKTNRRTIALINFLNLLTVIGFMLALPYWEE